MGWFIEKSMESSEERLREVDACPEVLPFMGVQGEFLSDAKLGGKQRLARGGVDSSCF